MVDVSIIIVNWNTRELLRACLASCPDAMRRRADGSGSSSNSNSSSSSSSGSGSGVDSGSGSDAGLGSGQRANRHGAGDPTCPVEARGPGDDPGRHLRRDLGHAPGNDLGFDPSDPSDPSDPVRGEIVVIDNASSDGSAEMVARDFPGVRLIRNQENRGFAAANNQGLAVASGRYALLLNSDTEVLEDAIERSVAWADAHDDVAVMGCRVLNPDRTMQPTCFRDPGLVDLTLIAAGLHHAARPVWLARLAGRQVMRDWDRTDERDVDVVTGCYMLVRRTAIDRVGMLDEGFFFYGEEADWCRRFRDAGYGVRFAPVGEIIHLGGASTLRIAGERGVMLGRAITRLIGKHRGPIVAIAAWTILLASHIWRAVALGVAGTCTLDRTRLSRARVAASTALRFTSAWPKLT
ncbi:MAG: glycosyltransferase family 2 protein [Phycisphaerales bacterium]